MTRDGIERWLLRHGFSRRSGRNGHLQYHRPASPVKGDGPDRSVTITIPGHGPRDLSKKHAGMIVRALSIAGFGDVVQEEAS